jgi:hypothetical protein
MFSGVAWSIMSPQRGACYFDLVPPAQKQFESPVHLVYRDETFPLKSGFPTFEAENWVLGFMQICNKNGGGG